MQNLTVALTSADRAVGLFSLPASPTEMTDDLREWQDKLTKVVGRVGKDLVVNDASEVSEIVRRRLFEECGRDSMRRAVSRQFAGWVFNHRDRLPPEWGQLSEDQIRAQFESCGGQTDKAAHLPELYFAVGDPDTDTALVHTAVQDLERRCYFLRGVGVDGWRFGHGPTLKKVHADRQTQGGADLGTVERCAEGVGYQPAI